MVRIGLIAPFEGLGRPLGYAMLPTVKAAVAEANADGRLGRYRVALVVLNDDLDPAAAAAQAQALAQDGPAGTGAEQVVIAVLGPFDTATAEAAAPILTRAGIPALIAAPASGLRAGVHSLCPTSSQIAAALQSRAPRPELCPENVTVGIGACYTAADAAAAADDLRRWRAGGWRGTLFGGPDLFRPWLIQRGGEAAEGTVAAACAPVGLAVPASSGDPSLAHAAALADAGVRALLAALADDAAAHGRPTRAGVAEALARRPISPGLAWYRVERGAWVNER